MGKIAFAVAAHPDDIELMMAGTLILLKRAGYQTHYMNIASGSCGTATLGRDEIVAIRAREAREAAASLGAVFHPPLVDDIEIFYDRDLLGRLAAVVRQADPTILLVPSPQDYMEDHTNACRLAVSAAFCRNMPNFATVPPTGPVATEMAVYHALPYGLRDPLRNEVRPGIFVDISSAMKEKEAALSCHRSQKDWLDTSQGIGSYVRAMTEMCARVGRMSGRFACAEGWRRHLHLGFGREEFDPLPEALAGRVLSVESG